MRFFKNVFSKLHVFVLWALMSAIFWGWIFTFVTDTSPDKKVSVYFYVPEIRDTELAVELERDMPAGLKMVKVHNFQYVMFNMESVENGDVFVLPESQIGEYRELLTPGDAGRLIYDAETRTGGADSYAGYEDEDYYLFIGVNSVHRADGAAEKIAEDILKAD